MYIHFKLVPFISFLQQIEINSKKLSSAFLPNGPQKERPPLQDKGRATHTFYDRPVQMKIVLRVGNRNLSIQCGSQTTRGSSNLSRGILMLLG